MQTRAHFIRRERENQNQNAVNNLFSAAGWVGNYTYEELDLIGRSVNDLPHPETDYIAADGYDWVDDNGIVVLPSIEIPFRYEAGVETVVYNNRTFTISYYPDGTVRSVQ